MASANTQQVSEKSKAVTVRLVAWLVGINGIFIIVSALIDQILTTHQRPNINEILFDLPLLIGVSLLYLSTLLARQKRNAWIVVLLAYMFYIAIGITAALLDIVHHESTVLHTIETLLLPITVVGLLLQTRHYFMVASDRRGFMSAVKFSLFILLIALLYGIGGYMLMDVHDYHQEISFVAAVHFTINQFDLTASPIHAYTARARIFDSSLSLIGIAAIGYVFIAFFQPIRDRVRHRQDDRVRIETLLQKYGGYSEDYFKIWPHDKQYFFDDADTAAVAYAVHAGVALCLGNPVGNPRKFAKLGRSFKSYCFKNDWKLAFVHIDGSQSKLYETLGLTMQKIGSEAVVDVQDFTTVTLRNKYFRHINNKFTKLGYTSELLTPPHSLDTIATLQSISDEWLSKDGREERGFVMGYFSEEYMQRCDVLLLKDENGAAQAFLNIIPADFDTQELTYDMLRNRSDGLSNSIDYLMIQLINYASEHGYTRINLGLCPLYGMKDQADKQGILDRLLHFTFTYGNRVYSFSGLHRFKSKFKPVWRDRYLAYEDGVSGLTKTVNALIRSMRV